MATFQYTALTRTGERTAGVLSAASEQGVLSELERRQLIPVELKEQADGALAPGAGHPRRRVRRTDLARTYTQIGDLLRAGVPLLRALRLIANRRGRPALASVFGEVADAVQDGGELAEAMRGMPDVFPEIHNAMVRAGEKGGFLDGALTRLGQLVQRQVELRAKVVGSLIYPCVICTFGAVVFSGLLFFFVPLFGEILQGRDLPALTRLVLGASALLRGWWPLLAVLAVAAAVGAPILWRHPVVRRRWGTLVVRAPVVGPILNQLAIARFCRVLGTLLGNGVPMLGALQIAREAAGLPALEDAIAEATGAVRAGEPLAGPLGASGLFGDDVLDMISVGESANNLDEVLLEAAQTLEGRVDGMLAIAVRLVEPLLIMLLGVAVAGVAIALVLPMLQMTGQLDV